MANEIKNLEMAAHKARRQLWNGESVSHIAKGPDLIFSEALQSINEAGTGVEDLISLETGDVRTVPGDLVITGDLTVGGAQSASGVFADPVEFEDTALFDAAATFAAVAALGAAGFTMAAIARTATADGLTTGTIASGPTLQFIAVTSAGANNIIVLPAPTTGSIVVLHVAATGFELRTSAPATVAINGGTDTAAESAIAAGSTVVMICATATAWKGLQLATNGDITKVEVAAN